MIEPVRLSIPLHAEWAAGACLQLYTDWGTGTVNTSKPLLARPLEVHPNYPISLGWLDEPWLATGWLSAKPSVKGGHLTQKWLVDPWLEPPERRTLVVNLPAAYANWKFAAQAVDRVGNLQSGALQELTALVSGTEPPALATFTFASYSAVNDQVTFNLTAGVEV